jgi:outer membrane protein assembly factor BamB
MNRVDATKLILRRRTALLLPLATAGCSLFDNLFSENKKPVPGKRVAVLATTNGLDVDEALAKEKIFLPPPVRNAAWPQDGGNPAHLMGHLALGDRVSEAWAVSIGEGGGYRQKILARPIVVGGVVFAMDSSGVISAHDIRTGRRRWRFDTKSEDDDSTNVGGGLAIDGGMLYAVNGLAELVALDPSNGKQRWRRNLGVPARSAPTVADGRLFVVTIEDKLLALASNDGRQLWTHQAVTSATGMLGQPAPAYADGFVLAGFGSGELASLRADSGATSWTDSLASSRHSVVGDVSAIRGLPVIANGRVYAIGVGGLLVALDLRSGRRLWERDIAGTSSPWVAGDWLFVISDDQHMAAMHLADGHIAWASDLPRWKDEEKQEDPIYWFGPVLAGDRLIAAGTNKEALAVSPYTGAILGRQKLSAAASLGPVVADGTVLLVTDDGKLMALR